MKSLNRFESRLLFGLTSLLVLSACTTPNPDSTPIKPASSPIPALVSPTETSLAIARPTPTPKPPEATPTPVKQEQGPVFSGRSLMKSEDGSITAEASDSVLDAGGIATITTEAKYLTDYGKFAKAILASQLAQDPEALAKYPILANFAKINEKTTLQEAIRIYDENKNSFNIINFSLGSGVSGQIEGINTMVVGTEGEWTAIINLLKSKNIQSFLYYKPASSSTTKTLMYFESGKLNLVTSYHDVRRLLLGDIKATGLFTTRNLFTAPLMDTHDQIGFITGKAIKPLNNDLVYEIFNCINCTAKSTATGYFNIATK